MTILRHSYRCPRPVEDDDDDYATDAERHLSWIDYWDRKANQATLDRARGTYAAILPYLVAATGLPTQELVRRSAGRWLAQRREEEATEEAAYRASLARWYRTYGPGGHHRPDLEYG